MEYPDIGILFFYKFVAQTPVFCLPRTQSALQDGFIICGATTDCF